MLVLVVRTYLRTPYVHMYLQDVLLLVLLVMYGLLSSYLNIDLALGTGVTRN